MLYCSIALPCYARADKIHEELEAMRTELLYFKKEKLTTILSGAVDTVILAAHPTDQSINNIAAKWEV